MTTDSWSSEEAPYPVAHADKVWMPGDIAEGDYFRRRGYLKAARMLIHACDNRSGEHLLLPALGATGSTSSCSSKSSPVSGAPSAPTPARTGAGTGLTSPTSPQR
ncbi:MAG TPA: hypothetical protein VF557_11565 [Jatrophihabitans sp.]|jgi:hypothetical protein|uniref:hypothetical protein n=1 Tax=Jatrophihabitans sp. TaxID=1932789 RepID=UPI002EDE24AD